jgi:outer membrane receptor protein involved in Fe transport
MLNYKIGLDYNYFTESRPKEEELVGWFSQEHFVGVRSNWQYKSSNNALLSNMSADFDVQHNDYRYGILDSTLANGVDSGLVSSNTVIYLRPIVKLYGKNEKLQLKFGGELAVDIKEKTKPSLYPIAELRYSLFDDLFIPYVGVEGGLVQQRFEHLAMQNEFVRTNIHLQNMQRYGFNFGIKGTLSKRMSFNVGAHLSTNRDMALFVNDTIHSSGNRFGVLYDTISIRTLSGSLSYQHNEQLKIDGILRLHSYDARNNPYAWNLPQLEFIARGSYNIADKLLLNLDVTFEGGRQALVFDPTLPKATEVDGFYTVPLGLIVDGNLGVEYRYSKRLSFFMNVNNFAAQRYQRWFNYPVQAFQFMLGATFRF